MMKFLCKPAALFCLAGLSLPAFANNSNDFVNSQNISSEQQAVRLFASMQGRFDSSAQAASDADFRDVTMTICEVNVTDVPAYAAGRFLYVEQALTKNLGSPYRQRFYRIKNIEKLGKIASTTYEPSNPFVKTSALGMCQKSLQARSFSWSEIGLARCDVFLTGQGENFSGSTGAQGCKSTLYGASYMTQEFAFDGNTMTTWDRGYSADGKQVWGAEKAPYIFSRLAQNSEPFPARRPQQSACSVRGWSLDNSVMFKKTAGVWEGVWYRYDALGKMIETYTSVLEQKVQDCKWVQKNSYPKPDGTVQTREFFGTAVAPGVVQFDGKDDPRFINYNAFVKEVSSSVLVYEVSQKFTGQLTYVETITIVSPNQRLRTGTRYSDRGEFLGTTVIVETRTR